MLHLKLFMEHAEFMPKALVAPHPSIYGGTIDNPKEGTAFEGRLRFSVVQRDFDPAVGFLKKTVEGPRSIRSADPDSPAVLSVVNYQMLRLTFLYNKAIGQGLFQVEIFQHFDVDCRGEIGESCLSDGLKRLGIFLTTAETNTFFKRFKPNEKGMITFNSFLGTLGGEVPIVAKMQAPVKQDCRESMIKERNVREYEIKKENYARAATAAALLSNRGRGGPHRLHVINAKSLYEARNAAQEAGKTRKLGKSQKEKIKKRQQERFRLAQLADSK